MAIRDEVVDLEQAGISIIQIDEPAIREGLPLKQSEWNAYIKWTVDCFRRASTGVEDQTQIHTRMCYSEFYNTLQAIADVDADVISIETRRSQMELLDAFAEFNYSNAVGLSVYDIHFPRDPKIDEVIYLLSQANHVIPVKRLWGNPDCGLKTRGWDETKQALKVMVDAAVKMRNET